MLCHQLARPFESVEQSDPNWTERIHFPVVSTDGRIIIDVGFGRYANRDVIDGFGGVAMGSKVFYVRGSRQLRPAADEVRVGPLRWEVIEGLKTVRCTLDDNDQGIAWDLLYEASFPASSEEYHSSWRDGRLLENQVRFYQMGGVTGWLQVDGERIEVTPATFRANRDRSWGVRQALGPPDTTMKPPPGRGAGGVYNFAYIQFDGWALQHFRTDDADGNPTYHFAERYFPDRVERLPDLQHTAQFHDDGFRLRSGTYTYTSESGEKIELSYEASGTTFPTGAVGGYSGYKGFLQGRWMGEDWLDTGALDLSDPTQLSEVRGLIDYACTVRCGDEVGHAIVECVTHGTYRPYGIGL
jgi:hypothetical protein